MLGEGRMILFTIIVVLMVSLAHLGIAKFEKTITD